jgi:hypothetical protein
MPNFHVEVHSRDRQIEHYIVQNAESKDWAESEVIAFYRDKGQRCGIWEKEEDRLDGRIPYLIFNTVQLEDKPVVYITGEYRSQFPI